jgi:hypothetical protein
MDRWQDRKLYLKVHVAMGEGALTANDKGNSSLAAIKTRCHRHRNSSRACRM